MNIRRFFRYKRCSVKHVTNSTNSVLVYCGWATTMNESSKSYFEVERVRNQKLHQHTKHSPTHQTTRKFARQNQLHTILKYKHTTKEYTHIPKQ